MENFGYKFWDLHFLTPACVVSVLADRHIMPCHRLYDVMPESVWCHIANK